MISLPKLSVRNPILVNLLMYSIIIGGVFCALTLVREMFPEIRPKQVMIARASSPSSRRFVRVPV